MVIWIVVLPTVAHPPKTLLNKTVAIVAMVIVTAMYWLFLVKPPTSPPIAVVFYYRSMIAFTILSTQVLLSDLLSTPNQ